MSEVRCIDADGSQIGVIPTREALMRAHEQGMDLIEVAPNAQPPVCRITDFGKYKYEEEKKEKASRKHQNVSKVKEVKYHSNVDEHDYQTKLRHIKEFIAEGHRVKVSLTFRGRESAHQDLGYQVMRRVLKDLEAVGTSENPPQQMGRSIIMLVSPRPAVKTAAKQASST